MPNPFDEVAPHPLAEAAARDLMRTLPSLSEGKMFGVLVVRGGDGGLGYLAAFSGLLNGEWQLDGFAPPIFDAKKRSEIEPAGDARVKRLSARLESLEAELRPLMLELSALETTQRKELTALRQKHASNKAQRQLQRVNGGDTLALDQLSRADKAERRKMEDEHERVRDPLEQRVKRLQRRVRAQARLRQLVSRKLMQQLFDTYTLRNPRAESASLRSLYSPDEPPSGAGDCAAPKLFAAALTAGLTPVALAEFWWGPPPKTGGRVHANFYPACKAKCGPLLPFMLRGWDVQPHTPFAVAPPNEPLRVLHEDEDVVVIEKPCGLLSVPAKNERDSVLSRLRERHPDATGPMIVHRLDLDTSGVLVVALNAEAYANLQRQFARREVHKRYVAWLDGVPTNSEGVVDLPLRVDLDDRPRQIHDPKHGLAAVTNFRVVGREGNRARVELTPITGRTHQLRVHAAHPQGLGAPIVGDRLYGRAGERLLLHAETLAFRHPRTGESLRFEAPAPW